MRLTVFTLGLALLFIAGCGQGNAFEFVSEARAGTGDAIKIAYDIRAGEGVRMRMVMSGQIDIEADGNSQSMPTDMTMGSEYVCREVRDNGDMLLEMKVTEMKVSMDAQAIDQSDMADFKLTMVLTKKGQTKDVKMEGGAPMMAAQVNEMMNQPGFANFIPMPEEGLRIGEALDLTEILPREKMQKLLSMAGPGVNINPDLTGEMVLMGTKTIGGEMVAEWKYNMVLNMAGTMSEGGKSGEMDIGMKLEGTQFTTLRTGLPVGDGKMKMVMRGDFSGNGQSGTMSMEMNMDYTCEPIEGS